MSIRVNGYRRAFLVPCVLLAACGGDPAHPDGTVQRQPSDIDTVSEAARLAPERGFAWSDQLTGSYNPNPSYSFNGAGGPITITNTATGTYNVVFGNMSSYAGNAQAVAYGANGNRCKVGGWSGGFVQVICHTASGTPTNSQFVVSYTNDLRTQPGVVGGFLWSDQLTGTFNPNPIWSFNSSGQASLIANVGTGQYIAQLTGVTTDHGNAQITAYGSDPSYCKTNGWFVSQGSLFIGILCFNAAGQPQNTLFSLQFVSMLQPPGEVYDRSFFWADQPGTASYTPNANYNWSTLDQNYTSNTAVRNGLGQYTTTSLDIRSVQMSTTMITALGNDPIYCKPVFWQSSGDSTQMRVFCLDNGGNYQDSTFSAMYLHQESDCRDAGCPIGEHLIHPGRVSRLDNPCSAATEIRSR